MSHRVLQWLIILLTLTSLAGGYFYWQARAGTKLQQSTDVQMSTNLVGYWSFDGDDISGTTAYDRSGQGNNGTLLNGATLTSGKLGQALSLDGTNDNASIPDQNAIDFNYNQDFTVSVWTSVASLQTNLDGLFNPILEKWNNTASYSYVIRYLNQNHANWGKIAVARYDGTHIPLIYSTNTINDGGWHQITFSKSGATLSLYVDGVLNGTTTDTTTTTTTNTVPVWVGSLNNNQQYLKGSVDEVRIYNAALTASQVYDLYKLGGETVGASTPTRDSLNEGLAGYWKLDDASGTTAVDSSTNGNNGTLTNGPTWGTGRIGGAVTFDGSNDYILTDSSTNIANKSFTVSMWAKHNLTGNSNWMIGQGSASYATGLHFGFMGDNKVRCSFYGSPYNFDTGSSYTDTGWHLWVCGYDALTNQITIYRDGNSIASGTLPDDYSGTGQVRIGAFLDGSSPFSGELDEVRIYNRALSADEVTKLYKTTTPGNPDTRLKGYWSFDGDAVLGTTALDLSGAGNNGTLTNGPITSIGIRGQAIDFFPNNVDLNAFVTLGDPASGVLDFGSGDFTISTFFKSRGYLAQGFTWNGILTKFDSWSANSAGYGLTYTVSGLLDFQIRNGTTTYTVSSPTSILDASWHHAVGVRSGNTIYLYLDGVLVGSTAVSGSISNAMHLYLGGAYTAQNESGFKGMIDELRIYNAALTASEIWSLYQEGNVKVNKSQSNNGDSLNDGLAGYWKLDDASGTTAADSSVNSGNGTLTNGPTWGTGQIGGATTFDGTNDYITVPDSTALRPGSSSWSVCTWANPSNTNQTSYLVSKGTTPRFALAICAGDPVCLGGAGKRLIFSLAQELVGPTYRGAYSSVDVTTGGWRYFCGVANKDTNTVKLYVDGAEVSALGGSGGSWPSLTNSDALTLGSGTASNYYAGSLDETRIYSRALSSEEIAKLYKTTSPTNPETGLVGYWSFNGADISGTTAYDRSGKGNNGTLTNGPTLTIGRVGQAVNFDGVNDSIVTPSIAMDPANGRSFSAWFKINSLAAEANILNQNSTILNVRTDGSIRFYWTGGGYHYTSGITLTTGTWYHIVGVETTTSVSNYKVYINGTKYLDEDDPWAHYGGSGALTIGSNASAQYFPGVIDEVRAYTKSLSAVEVSNLYNLGR